MTKAAKDLSQTPVDVTKATLCILSLSKEFQKLGIFVGDCFAEGIAASGMSAMMDDAIAVPAPQLPAGRGGFSGVNVALTINVEGHAGGKGAREMGQAMGETVSPQIVSALIDLFERVAVADGSAA